MGALSLTASCPWARREQSGRRRSGCGRREPSGDTARRTRVRRRHRRALEEGLAGRVALCLWRLRRVTAYETAMTAVGLEEVPEAVRTALAPDLGKTDHEQLARAEEALQAKQKVLDAWAGAFRLLQELP